MSEDIYAKPDLTKKVRFQTEEKEDGSAHVCDNRENVTIYDNYRVEENTPPEDQQQTTSVNVPPGKRNLAKAAAVFVSLLCLLLLAADIVVVVLLIQDKNLNANLTSERDKLWTSYSEIKRLNLNLTQATHLLENDNDLLKAMKNNLTKERDDLQKRLEASVCPDNWIKFGNSCYSFSTSKKSWSDSRQSCEKLDAQLVIVSSEEEQTFLSVFVNTWIGLTDEEEENVWKWVDGSVVNTTYWKNGQPDNKGYKNDEDCVQTNSASNDLNNWNDLTCTEDLHFMCEKTLQ
ncbi:C-type lectin domain family 4 member M-like isoform X2 [Toxotes jaculatrix]|uniref:C-type lectin domain family 4 member M-like isoform X2 n=1 Tax=Toxotes jaculatrix TaxID=941984 RepID=UPI001B3AEF6B|nr:C-type lectin domain family 4 member M-like isoform X2 [Toxotes jaculatrix]